MATYAAGDSVTCKISYGEIPSADAMDYERTYHFNIVCETSSGYLISVPTDVFLKNSFQLTEKDCKVYGLHKKFANAEVHHITDKHIVALRSRMTGIACYECNTHCEHAEVNRLDENGHGILICWNCRNYRHYKHYR